MSGRDKNHHLEAIIWDEFQVAVDTPEKRLMQAVLMRALFDLTGSATKEDRRDARRFFKDDPRDREMLYSLHSIATYLSNDADAFKAGVLRHVAELLDGNIVRKSCRTVKPQ